MTNIALHRLHGRDAGGLRLGVGLGLLLLGCVATGPATPFDYSTEPDPRKSEFVVGVSDSLHITVWKNPELSTDARVRPDGTITMPLLGDLRASGRTPSQLREDIRTRMAAFVKDEGAAVSVAVTEVNSYRFTVAGNVEHGGVFTSRTYVTVAEAVAMAGGPNKFASPDRTVLVRGTGGRRIPVDLEQVRSGLHPEQDLALLAGDTIFVP
jgi:polysaccharide export outer membrane protein